MNLKPLYFITLLILVGCAEHDPILAGKREDIFESNKISVLNKKITSLGEPIVAEKCDYYIDADNIVWHGTNKVFEGIPTDSEINTKKHPACSDDYIYAGLSTGELVKVDSKNGSMLWKTDIFEQNSPQVLTQFLDVTATPVVDGNFIYVGGLGEAFCKLKDSNGDKVWCLPISTTQIVYATKNFKFILSDDNHLFAISNDGSVFWRAKTNGKLTIKGNCAGNVNLMDGKECE